MTDSDDNDWWETATDEELQEYVLENGTSTPLGPMSAAIERGLDLSANPEIAALTARMAKQAQDFLGHAAQDARNTVQAVQKQLAQSLNVRDQFMRTIQPDLNITEQIREDLFGFARAQESLLSSIASQVELPHFRLPPLHFEKQAEFLRQLAEQLRKAQPDNWPAGGNVGEIAAFVGETPLAMVWLPRAEIVTAIVTADDPTAAVIENSKNITDDARTVLVQLHDPDAPDDITYCAGLLRQVADLIDLGHVEGAQALATIVLTTTLQVTWEYESFGQAKRDMAKAKNLSIRQWRLALIAPSIEGALRKFNHGDRVEPPLSRHTVTHHAHPVQLTPFNAIASLILTTALLRESYEQWAANP